MKIIIYLNKYNITYNQSKQYKKKLHTYLVKYLQKICSIKNIE